MSPLSQLRREKPRKREIISEEISPPRPFKGTAKMVPLSNEGPFPIAPPTSIKAPVDVYTGRMKATAKTDEPGRDVVMLLASNSGLRDAMILREILGPPRGLRMDAM
jgi:hypothetical protein